MSDDRDNPSQPPREVLFMPWAGLGVPITIGPFQFVPWSKLSVVDQGIRDYLNRYFGRYVDHFGKAVKSVTLVSLDSDNFTPSPYLPHEEPRNAVNVLIFSTIGAQVIATVRDNDNNLAPPTADRYQLLQKSFRPTDEVVAVQVGGSTHIGAIKDIFFPMPWDLGGRFTAPNEDMVAALGKLMDGTASRNIRTRIFRALEWFRLAHIASNGIGDLSRVVMMATAFEILFEIPEGQGKTKKFVEEVASHLKQPTTKMETRNVTIKRRNKKGTSKPVNRSLPGWWANDFYDLRSRVVHGDEIDQERLRFRDWISQLIVADVVFWQCVTSELYQQGYLGSEIHAMKDDPDAAPMVGLLECLLLDSNSHRTLGWIP